jgi:hypothetical protein
MIDGFWRGGSQIEWTCAGDSNWDGGMGWDEWFRSELE